MSATDKNMPAHRFLAALAEMIAASADEEDVRLFVCDQMDRWLGAGKMREVTLALERADLSAMPVDVIMALVGSTAAAEGEIAGWRGFLGRAREEVQRAVGMEEMEEIFGHLG